MYGCYTSTGAIVNNLVAPYGFGSNESSIIGACLILSGLVSSFILSGYVDRSKNYLGTFSKLCICTLLATLCMFATLKSKQMLFFLPNAILLGAVLVPIIPLGFSFSTEITFPISEPMTNGTLVLSS